MRSALHRLVLLLACLFHAAVHAESPPVGEISFKRGSIHAAEGSGPERALEVADPVHRGDRLRSGPRSFSVVRFEDANKLAVRPNTLVVIADFLDNEAAIALQQGGLQATVRPTGRPGASRVYRFDAGTVEIDVEDARFDLRHCGPECAAENLQVLESQGALPEGAIGRVALVRGSVEVTGGAGATRRLRMGQPVFPQDTLRSAADSHALLVFSDGGQLVVDQDSTVRLGDIRLRGQADDQFEAELVSGGMRALSGMLGKRDAGRVKFRTPVASTGIRGTGFDLICQGSCRFDAYTGQLPSTRNGWPDGLYGSAWEGTIVPANEAGGVDVQAGGFAYVPNPTTPPRLLSDRPEPLDRLLSPRPVRVDAGDDRAHQDRIWRPEPGTYLYVHDGEIRVRGETPGAPPRVFGANRYVHVTPEGAVVSGQGAPPFLYYDAACPRCTEE